MRRLTKLLPLSLAGLLLAAPSASAGKVPPTGEEVFNAFGCRGCHLVAGSGGSRGPALDGVGGRLAPEQLRTALTVRRENSAMPVFDYFTEAELTALLAYLGTL